MKPDIYTKAVLTVIAIMVTVIAGKPLVSPDTTASAQSAQFAGIQFGSAVGVLYFFDSHSGEIWAYNGYTGVSETGKLDEKYRLTKLGQPLTVEKSMK